MSTNITGEHFSAADADTVDGYFAPADTDAIAKGCIPVFCPKRVDRLRCKASAYPSAHLKCGMTSLASSSMLSQSFL